MTDPYAASYEEHYEEIGRLLYTARRQMQLEIDHAAQILHIRTRYLEALERGKLEDLPGLPYAKGYLQTYAAFLGLDKDEILRRFEQVEALIGKKGFYFPDVLTKTKTPNRSLVWGGLAVLVVVYLLWAIFLKHSENTDSVVEPYHVFGQNPDARGGKGACFSEQHVLYPPCTAKAPHFGLLPLQKGKIDSVLELPHRSKKL